MSDNAASRIAHAIDSLGTIALQIKAERDDLENKIAIARVIIDRCIRLAEPGAGRIPFLDMDSIAVELRTLRQGVLK